MCPGVFKRVSGSPGKIFGLALLVLIAGSNQVCSSPGASGQLQLERIQLPPGFSIDLYASAVPGARSMTLSDSGVLFVGSRGTGNRVNHFTPSSGGVAADLGRSSASHTSRGGRVAAAGATPSNRTSPSAVPTFARSRPRQVSSPFPCSTGSTNALPARRMPISPW